MMMMMASSSDWLIKHGDSDWLVWAFAKSQEWNGSGGPTTKKKKTMLTKGADCCWHLCPWLTQTGQHHFSAT
jgi:hypothetical protein